MNDAKSLNEDSFSPDLPELGEEPVRHEKEPDQYPDTIFNHVLIQNTPFIGKDIHSGPLACINDGYNDIIVQPTAAGRFRLANVLI